MLERECGAKKGRHTSKTRPFLRVKLPLNQVALILTFIVNLDSNFRVYYTVSRIRLDVLSKISFRWMTLLFTVYSAECPDVLTAKYHYDVPTVLWTVRQIGKQLRWALNKALLYFKYLAVYFTVHGQKFTTMFIQCTWLNIQATAAQFNLIKKVETD